MLCEEDSPESAICSLHPDGPNDGEWLASRVHELGLSNILRLTTLRISRGDSLPGVSDFDAVIIGGTFHGVHDNRPWQQSLQPWLHAHRATGNPLLGICGGHQAMAVALGGKVTKRSSGMQVGSVPVQLTQAGTSHPLFAGICSPPPRFHFGNSDEVTTVPKDSTILASTSDSPAVAIDYGGGWRSVQYHPEATASIFQHWVDTAVLKPPTESNAFRHLVTGRQFIGNFLSDGLHQLNMHQIEQLPHFVHKLTILLQSHDSSSSTMTKALSTLLSSVSNPEQLFTASQTDFDEHQWNLFYGLVEVHQHSDLMNFSAPLLNTLCRLIPPRELLLIALPSLQTSRSMHTRILLSRQVCAALNRTQRKKSKVTDDYLSLVRKYIQLPLLNEDADGAEEGTDEDEDEDENEEDAAVTARADRALLRILLRTMPVDVEKRASLSFSHTNFILSSLDLALGVKVKAADVEAETCCLRASLVNFACLALEDYGTMQVAPMHGGHGCRFPPSSSSSSSSPSDPPRFGRAPMTHPPSETMVRCAASYVVQTCSSVVDVLSKSHDEMPWVTGRGDIGSIKGLARSEKTKEEREDEQWSNERRREMESSGDDEEGEEGEEGGEEEELMTGIWTACGHGHTLELSIGRPTPSRVGLGVMIRSLLSAAAGKEREEVETRNMSTTTTTTTNNPAVLLPSVLHPHHLLSLCIPSLIDMISHRSIAVTDKGVELLSLLTSHVSMKRAMGGKEWKQGQLPPPMKWMALSQACILFVVNCPDPYRREHCWKTWINFLEIFTLTHELLLVRHIIQSCPHNNVVAMLMDVAMRNCMKRAPATAAITVTATSTTANPAQGEEQRLCWVSSMVWSVWDRARTDSVDDLYKVAEVYMSCMTLLRTCLMFERRTDQNVYGLWPSVGAGRLEDVETFCGQVLATMEARVMDLEEIEKSIEMETEGSSGRIRGEERLQGMNEERARLGIMEHNGRMLVDLIKEKKGVRGV